MRTSLLVILALQLAGCAATSSGDYVKVYDRKYNETRVARKESAARPGDNRAVSPELRPSGQHP